MATGGQALSTAALVMQATHETGQSEEDCIQAGAKILKGYSLSPCSYSSFVDTKRYSHCPLKALGSVGIPPYDT